jgi:hypothetical protein
MTNTWGYFEDSAAAARDRPGMYFTVDEIVH